MQARYSPSSAVVTSAVHDFLARLDEGYDLVQGSRFVPGGVSENLPLSRSLAARRVKSESELTMANPSTLPEYRMSIASMIIAESVELFP